jgi:hypothetical protein
MLIASIYVFGWGKEAPWKASSQDIGHGALVSGSHIFGSTFDDGLFSVTIDASDLIWDI